MSFDLDLYSQSWRKIESETSFHLDKNIELIPLLVFDRLDSTNTKLWSLIDDGIECPTGAIALLQTAGKGQWGHSWVSQPGGLYLSVGLSWDMDIVDYPHLVMATAWGIATALRAYNLPVTIKWSNDLILERRKLGGIKIETRNHKNKLTKAVVGVGINWQNSVPHPGINLKSYYRDQNTAQSIKQIASLEALTAITAYGILLGSEYYLAWGIEKLLARYLETCNSIGKQIDFNGCAGEVVGVTTEGKLKVKLRSPGASSIVELAPGQISLGYS
ncbi:MAG: biotin--[acetyl-CoA-carboxylase] ligase [Cyanobacteria bacterium J06600_6]